MLAEIALAALLDSATVATPAAKETIYVMQVQPQAAVKPLGESSDAAKYVVGGIFAAVGSYLIIHGSNNPKAAVVISDTGSLTVTRTTNPEVYFGVGTLAISAIILAVK